MIEASSEKFNRGGIADSKVGVIAENVERNMSGTIKDRWSIKFNLCKQNCELHVSAYLVSLQETAEYS
jgi:hypothetical protein